MIHRHNKKGPEYRGLFYYHQYWRFIWYILFALQKGHF
jgi:hypothetical protein